METAETAGAKGLSCEAMDCLSERLSLQEDLYFPRALQSTASNPSQRKAILLDLLSRDVAVFLGSLSLSLYNSVFFFAISGMDFCCMLIISSEVIRSLAYFIELEQNKGRF